MRKHMTDEDIIDLFDSSADKEAVVDAVAVSLRTTRTVAREKLRELGCEIEDPLDGFVPVEPKRGRRKRAAPEPAAVAPTACQPGKAVDVNWNDIEPAPEETPPAASTEPVDAPQAMTAQQFLALAPELLTPRVARMPLMLDGKLVHDVAEVRIVVRGDQPCVDIRLAG